MLIQKQAATFRKDLFSDNVEFQTTMEGQRQIRRYVPELRSQADIVILLAEERPEAFAELLKGVKGIDLIVHDGEM